MECTAIYRQYGRFRRIGAVLLLLDAAQALLTPLLLNTRPRLAAHRWQPQRHRARVPIPGGWEDGWAGCVDPHLARSVGIVVVSYVKWRLAMVISTNSEGDG